MTTDDQSKYLIAETMRNALATVDKHRGRISRLWNDLTPAEQAAEVQLIADAITNDEYLLTTDDAELADLETVIITSLLNPTTITPLA